MRHVLLAAALALFAAPAFASDETDIMATINKMNDAMTKNDMKGASAAYTASGAIIDEFPPHVWSGSGVFDAWGKDFGKNSEQEGDTDGVVKTQKPLHVLVEGDHGYAVVPAVYTFKHKGKKTTESALWTFAMQKEDGVWKIAGWSWARR